jgi:nickel/cobalt transporter (NicO) family protein
VSVVTSGPAAVATWVGQAGYGWLEDRFARLVEMELGAGTAVLAVLVAVGLGVLHSLAPGHGKAIAAAWFGGGRGRPRDAVALGVVIAGMHTGAVLGLGLVLDLGSRGGASPERVTPWMLLTSGGLVVGLGAVLVRRHLRHARAGGHHHHLPADTSPLSRRGLLVLGAAGGLLPSPSAFLVLISSAVAGRLTFGLVLIAAFSVGLAATVAVVGLIARAGHGAVERRASHHGGVAERIRAALPVASSVVILLAGAVTTTLGVLELAG